MPPFQNRLAPFLLSVLSGATLWVSGCGSESQPAADAGSLSPSTVAVEPTDAAPTQDARILEDAALADGSRADASPDTGPRDASVGTCGPATEAGGRLDPNCVYLLGTLTPGTVGRNVVVHPRHPTAMLAGFYAPYAPTVRTNGGMLFVDSLADQVQRAFSFVPDALNLPQYPANPLANDPQLSVPGCTTQARTVYRVVAIPGSTDFLYDCAFAYGSFYRSGQLWFSLNEERILAVAPSGSALVTGTTTSRIVSNGTSVPISGIGQAAAARWINGAFLVAAFSNTEAATRAGALYSVDTAGMATKVADYVFGAGTAAFFIVDRCVLDPAGSMWCIGSRFGGTVGEDDVVLRMPSGAPAVHEYDEALGTVKIHGSSLFTGP